MLLTVCNEIFALVFVNVKDLSQCFVFNLIATWFFWAVFLFHTTSGMLHFIFSQELKYERERDGK